MSDLPDTGADISSQQTTGMPRWVKVSLIVVIGVVLLAATVHLAGGGMGRHGPGQHIMPASTAGR